jgi:myo-inositol-1(or 4)-monophosphatase
MTDLEKAIKIVRETNNLLRRHFQTLGLDAVRLKKNEEIVTEADLAANRLITKRLLQYFPNDDIISEEAKTIDNPGKDTWYVDPLDGTTNFSYGLRDFSTCLARVTPKKIDIGVVGIPLAKEVYWAQNGGPAYLNGKKIAVSTSVNHGSKVMILLCGGHTPLEQKKFIKIIKNLDPNKIRLRILSSAGIESTAVACGRVDGFISTGVKPWDILPGVLLIRAAGGKVTNLKGKEWTIKDSTIVASNGLVHEMLLDLAK